MYIKCEKLCLQKTDGSTLFQKKDSRSSFFAKQHAFCFLQICLFF